MKAFNRRPAIGQGAIETREHKQVYEIELKMLGPQAWLNEITGGLQHLHGYVHAVRR